MFKGNINIICLINVKICFQILIEMKIYITKFKGTLCENMQINHQYINNHYKDIKYLLVH